MGDRPPTGEPEKEKEEEREEKKKKEKKKEKKKLLRSTGLLGMLSATGASACGFRSPRFASGRRGRPGWRAASGQTRRGPGGSDTAPREDSTRLPAPRFALSCRRVHFVSCTLGKPRFPGAGRGPPRPGRRLERRMLTRPRLGRCSPAHSAPELMVLAGAGAVHFGRAVRPRLRGLHLF